jgi:hypothetical protein
MGNNGLSTTLITALYVNSTVGGVGFVQFYPPQPPGFFFITQGVV